MPDTAPQATASKAAKSRKKRERAADAVRDAGKKAKKTASDAVHATTEALDQNPFGAVAGAIAVGAVAAALIPATRRELEALGPWTDRMREALADAFEAAKDAGTGELSAAGLTLAAASDGLGGIVGKVVKAATVASTAAATSVRESRSNAGKAAQPANPEPTVTQA